MAARILVADDSVTIQKFVELTFSKEGFVLVQARSGEEAIQKAKAERPDLVLLDLVMPDKNGYEVCAALRADPALRAVPIILLTGTFEAFDKDKGTQAGANDFVTKPFESQVLIGKVKKLLPAKTADVVAPSAPAAPSQAAPPREVPRPAPAAVPPSPPGMAPRPRPAPSPAPAPPRGAAPGVMRGGVPPSPIPAAAPPRMAAPPPRPPAASAPARPAAPPTAVPPARPAPPVSAPPRPARMPDAPPPPERISQDRMPRVAPPPPPPPPSPAPGGFGELSLEDLTTLPLPETGGRPEDLHLRLEQAAPEPAPAYGELTLEPPPATPEPAPKPEEPAFPGSLSLDELLSAESAAAPPQAEPEPASAEESSGGPVFDLTSEMGGPPLPLIEVGAGEPPALSIEDLLVSREAATGGVPAVGAVVPPVAAATPSPGGPEAPLPDTAAMRQAITERVARELATDLSDKMLERIERIVWDVVPDLAEILIAKEIEKIRALAEGKQLS